MATSFLCGPSVPGISQINPAECMKPKRSLRYAGLHPRTLRAYRAAIDRFLKFVNKKHLKISKPRQLDRQIAEFIDVSFQEGEPLSYSGHLISAVTRFHPQLLMVLPQSSQFLRNGNDATCHRGRCRHPGHWLKPSWASLSNAGNPTWACSWAWASVAFCGPPRSWLSRTIM